MRAVIRSSIRQAIITIIVVEGSSLVIVNLLMMNRIRGEICCNHWMNKNKHFLAFAANTWEEQAWCSPAVEGAMRIILRNGTHPAHTTNIPQLGSQRITVLHNYLAGIVLHPYHSTSHHPMVMLCRWWMRKTLWTCTHVHKSENFWNWFIINMTIIYLVWDEILSLTPYLLLVLLKYVILANESHFHSL